MSVAKIDPVETFYSVGSSLVGRIFLFFSAGWVGLLIGVVAESFGTWEDFLTPLNAFPDFLDFTSQDLLMFLFWPLLVLIWAGSENAGLFFFFLFLFTAGFFAMVFSEVPVPLWWLVLVTATSSVPVLAFGGIHWPSVTLLAFFWAGMAPLAWWLLRKYHSGLVETLGNVVQGGLGENEPPPPARRKAPSGTWPEGVEGFEDDDEDS